MAKKIGLLTWPGMDLLDFIGPAEVFTIAEAGLEVLNIGLDLHPVGFHGAFEVYPDCNLASCPQLDVFVVPGGVIESVPDRERFLELVCAVAEASGEVLAVGTGAKLLTAAGVPPDTAGLTTTSGLTGGAEGALQILARMCGNEVAARVATRMERQPNSAPA